jgi:hypothetical protein
MQTLDPPTLLPRELSTRVCEQVVPGNADEEANEGRIGGGGPPPNPLQGGGDPEAEKQTGNEGDGP